MYLGEQQEVAQAQHPHADLGEAPGFWLWSGPGLGFATIWRINECVIALPPCAQLAFEK